MDLAREEEESAEKQEEENRAREVRVVHNMLIDMCQRIEDRESLIDTNTLALHLQKRSRHPGKGTKENR